MTLYGASELKASSLPSTPYLSWYEVAGSKQPKTVRNQMKLKPIGPNQTEVAKNNGITVFFSYSTPVAVFVPGKGALCTSTKYSSTTSKHINQAVARWGASKTEVDQGVIDQYANQ